MNKSERFILGIFRNLDDRQMARGQPYWLYELAYWILSGWYSVFTVITKRKGEVQFIADLWDPITVYPEWDSDGLRKLIRTFEVDKRTARSMLLDWSAKGLEFEYNEPVEEAKVKAINYWLDDRGKIYNAIMMGGQVIKPLNDGKPEKLFDKIPIFVGAVGMPERTSDDWQARYGESIVAANRDMYEYENMMISLMAQIMAETAYPNLISKSRSGAPVVKGEDVKGHGSIIPLRTEEELELLKHAATPTEANILLSYTNKQKQKGGFADAVYGGLMFETSGFLYSQLMATIRYKINPYLATMQKVISSVASEFLTQYKKGRYPKVTLSTTNPKEIRKGLFFAEEFSREDVPDSRFVEVTIPITSAVDRTQQILYARQAVQPPQLLSRETLWDSPDILDVQDSEQEYMRIIQDEVLELPVVKQIAAIEQLRERERLYRNQGKFAEAEALKKYIMMLEMQLGMRQGIPEKAGGTPPNLLPPEMLQSPDRARAALGTPSPGVTRKAQTPEERASRRGGLVNQYGEAV